MDTQLKRGIIEMCVLASLVKEDSYGYKIIKDVSFVLDISESTLYPILKRLESNEFLQTYSIEHNNRLRKYYKITRLGIEKLRIFISDWQDVLNIYNYIKGELK